MKTGVFYGTESNNVPYNMLINSNLRRPINQRGATYAPMWDYGIDMWKEYAGNARADFTFDANGMTLTGTIAQKIQSSAFITGNPYSAVLYMADGTVLVASGVVNIAGSAWTGFASAENGNVKITLFTDAQDGSYIGVRIGASGEKIRACALYEGEYSADTVPPYVPKEDTAEIMACKRWYLHLDESKWHLITRAYGDLTRFEVLGSFVRAPTLTGSPRAFVNDGTWHDLTIASVNLLADRCVVRFRGLEDLMTIGDTYLITGMKGMSCEP